MTTRVVVRVTYYPGTTPKQQAARAGLLAMAGRERKMADIARSAIGLAAGGRSKLPVLAISVPVVRLDEQSVQVPDLEVGLEIHADPTFDHLSGRMDALRSGLIHSLVEWLNWNEARFPDAGIREVVADARLVSSCGLTYSHRGTSQEGVTHSWGGTPLQPGELPPLPALRRGEPAAR